MQNTSVGQAAPSSLLQTGGAALQDGIRRAEQAASEIARLGGTDSATPGDASADSPARGDSTVSLSEAAVELLQAENQVQASAQVVATADELLGTIIDTVA